MICVKHGKDGTKKALLLASVASMIDQFNRSNINLLLDEGFEVHVGANFEEGNTCSVQRVARLKKDMEELRVSCFQIDFSRNIGKIRMNAKAYWQVKRLMWEQRYEFVHCHSPIGGVCGRLAACSTGTRAVYTAHGFHFFKGAPLLNWLLFYPVERVLARLTDTLITINREDFERACKFKARQVLYVPGVGVDTCKFSGTEAIRTAKRAELGLSSNDVALFSVGELNRGKNHEAIIRALLQIENTNILYFIAGIGPLEKNLRRLAGELGVQDRVRFLGFRGDVPAILSAADAFVFPSLREGLPVALMEAMAAGLPVVCSNIRGNSDLIKHGKGGYLSKPREDDFAFYIKKLLDNKDLWGQMGKHNRMVIQNFSEEHVQKSMRTIYASLS